MKNNSDTPKRDLNGYEVLVAVCGGIAAYKVCEVVSTMVQRGVGVTVAMTEAATKFVGPTTFEALSGRRVLRSMWQAEEAADVRHITLGDITDLTLIAPATANMIGKIAGGLADDMVSTLVISAGSPVLLAPAMNNRMWENPIVQQNVASLGERGFKLVGPGEGWLACRSVGPGRMAEPGEILDEIVKVLKARPAGRVALQES